MFRRIVILLWLTSCFLFGYSQNEETELSYAEQLLALESELDSASIFNLLDSVLLLNTAGRSEVLVRLGFTSSVTSAGRDFGIDQTGLSPGITYFHKSGVYADLAGYWNSNVTPNYNPTILAVGYLGTLSKKWGYSLDYERWIYNRRDTSSTLLTNALSTSLAYDFKVGFADIDYSYLFGDGDSHRIIGSLTGTIDLGKLWRFNHVILYPSASMLISNGDITTLRITNQQITAYNQRRIQRIDAFSQLSEQQIRYLLTLARQALENNRITQEQFNQLRRDILFAQSLTPEQVEELNRVSREGFRQQDYIDSNVFGILSYSFSLPVSLSTDRISILLSYTYSIPVQLPGEVFDVRPIGYFGASVTYRIPFK